MTPEHTQTQFIQFGPVHLNVTDLDRSIAFYREVLGMNVRRSVAPAVVGTFDRTLLVLHPGASGPAPKGRTGLTHVAIHLPTERDLAYLLDRIVRKGWHVSPTDHVIAKSLYVRDPDGITIELAVETPHRVVEYRFTEDEFQVIDDQGRLRNPIEALDTDELMALLGPGSSKETISDEAIVGHMHLHVADLRLAYDFYKKLGFTEHFLLPRAGWGDLGAGGAVEHRMALNVWAGIGAPSPDPDSAGLRFFTLIYTEAELLNQVLSVVPAYRDGAGHRVTDPSGNQIYLTNH